MAQMMAELKMVVREEKRSHQENWCCITSVSLIVTSINLLIVVFLRVLLDRVDDINEPLIQGELRNRLTIFLYIFVMTFFFGCWGCLCCCCRPCRYLAFCPSATSELITAVSHKFISRHPGVRRKLSTGESDVEVDEIVVASHVQPPPLRIQSSDHYAYENPVAHDEQMIQEAVPHIVIPPQKTPLGRMRSHSIDVSIK